MQCACARKQRFDEGKRLEQIYEKDDVDDSACIYLFLSGSAQSYVEYAQKERSVLSMFSLLVL